VAKVSRDSNIGVNGLGKSETAGYYGSGLRSASRQRKGLGMVYRVRRHARPIGMVLVFLTAVIVAVAVAPALSVNADTDDNKAFTDAPPGTPLLVIGYVTDSLGVAPSVDVPVTVTDNNTGAVWYTLAEVVNGSFYMVDVANEPPAVEGAGGVNWTLGDVMWIYATDGVMEGQNESLLADPYVWIDVQLNVSVIPEFPMAIVPVLGVVAIATVVSLNRRRSEL
jgi:hypothetical protein